MFTDFRLRVFLTVVREESFTNAAKALGVTQPAVSQNVAEIEKSVGVKLFDRAKGEVSLTDAGRSFKKYAENILYWYKAAESMFGEEGRLVRSRPIKIAADPLVASFVIPEAIISLTASMASDPKRLPCFIINAYDRPQDAVADLKIFSKQRNEGIDWDGVSSLIGVVSSSVICSPSNRIASASEWESAFSGIGNLPERGRLAVWQSYERLLSIDVESRVLFSSDSIEAIRTLVGGSSDYLGVVPYLAAKKFNDLRILPIPLPHLRFDIQYQPTEEFSVTAVSKKLCQAVSDFLA